MDVAEINSCLPEEMLRMIFSFLPPKDLKAAVLVCKLWCGVGQAPGLWSWVTFHAWNNEAVLEQMGLPRLQNVSRLNITAQNVSEELMEAVAVHPGLRKVETAARWTNLSSVRPDLLGRAFRKMEDLSLRGTKLTVDQLNCLLDSLASGFSGKGKLELMEKNLYADGIDPLLLAEAIRMFNTVKLSWPYVKLWVTDPVTESQQFKIVRHDVSGYIFGALGCSISFSCVRHLELNFIDLSAVDAEVLAKQVSMMCSARLQCCSITPQQATALFNAIGEDGNKLKMLDLKGNDLSSVCPCKFTLPVIFLKGLYLNLTNLTTHQEEVILRNLNLGNASDLAHLRLDFFNGCLRCNRICSFDLSNSSTACILHEGRCQK